VFLSKLSDSGFGPKSMGSHRSFTSDVEQLAAHWSETAVSKEAWQDLGQFGATESRPFRVQNGQILGLAKPGEKKATE
jgi:hypothetical protein